MSEPMRPIRHRRQPSWIRIGDAVALGFIALIFVIGLWTFGYFNHGAVRGLLWYVCGAMGVWSAVCLLAGRWQRHELATPRWILLGFAAILLLTGLQLVPLPRGITESLSPAWKLALEQMDAIGVEAPSRVPLNQAPDRGLLSWDQLFASTLFFACVCMIAARFKGALVLAIIVAAFANLESLLGLVRFTFGGVDRAYGAIYNPNHHAAAVVMGLPLAIALVLHWRRVRDPELRESLSSGTDPALVLVALLIFSTIGWLSSFSRGSFLFSGTVFVAWGAYELYGNHKHRRSKFSGGLLHTQDLVLITIAFVVLLLAGAFAQRYVDNLAISPQHAMGRIALWEATMDGFWESRGLGIGLAGTEQTIHRFLDIPRIKRPIWSHNDFIQFVAEVGIPGVLLVLATGFFAVRSFLRNQARRNEQYGWTAGRLQRAALAGFIAQIAHCASDFHLRIPLVGFEALILLALATTDGLHILTKRDRQFANADDDIADEDDE